MHEFSFDWLNRKTVFAYEQITSPSKLYASDAVNSIFATGIGP